MVAVDYSLLRFLSNADVRLLVAVELVQRNHALAPTNLIEKLSRLPLSQARRSLKKLLKFKLVRHEANVYDGYSLTYAGFDFLALYVLRRRGSLRAMGSRMGCGKESDVFMTMGLKKDYAAIEKDWMEGSDSEKEERSLWTDHHHHHQQQGDQLQDQLLILKVQRLGRCSFRSVARHRDYKCGKPRRGASWLYLSRLAATREFTLLQLLYKHHFPVPLPVDHNRHVILMEPVEGFLLNDVSLSTLKSFGNVKPQQLYWTCIRLLLQLAEAGLIHGDFNEFNLFFCPETTSEPEETKAQTAVKEAQCQTKVKAEATEAVETNAHPYVRVVVIDFPQVVSTRHPNAAELFDRDVQSLARFFQCRFKHFISDIYSPMLNRDVQRNDLHLDEQAKLIGKAIHDE